MRTVQVGTQVSGQIAAIHVDYNDRVQKGQLLARIDPTLQNQAVEEAHAQLERAQATMEQAQSDYTRNKQLFEARVVTASEFSTVQSNFSVQKANVKSALIALESARQNLSYTRIYAPIDGVIVERNVDVGQTVAANFSAPQLFLIANDLSAMQILVSVDESDISSIRTEQPVEFTVQAYPDQTFAGTVQKVRIQPNTQNNVVSYTAVVGVKNTTGRLLPGMTATVQFLTGAAHDVLLVPNAALRVRATPAMLAQERGEMRQSDSALLWTLDDKGTLRAVRVHRGISDGRNTAVEGARLSEGMNVVIGVPDASGTSGDESRNPFQSPRARQRSQSGAGG
jgi:HlyD family secretion protein